MKTATELPRVSYLGRFLDLVQVVAAAPEAGLTLSELAEQSGVPMSTASRLVHLLDEQDLVRREPDKRIVPGPALLTLGLRALRRLPTDRYHDAVQTLSELTGESVSVGLVFGGELTLVARRESVHPLRYVASVGDAIAPHRSAMGKAILAHTPPSQRYEIVRQAVGAQAHAVLADLTDELAEALETGVARDEEAFAVGLRCIAAPLLDPGGKAVGAISISGPSARFTRQLADAFVPELLGQTWRVSQLPIAVGV
ncbi:MAG: IclR family transcriptional regulator [Actinobacteria bacterium]|nr:IclR family transcriptional regulator [Actinomycetota bacterium]